MRRCAAHPIRCGAGPCRGTGQWQRPWLWLRLCLRLHQRPRLRLCNDHRHVGVHPDCALRGCGRLRCAAAAAARGARCPQGVQLGQAQRGGGAQGCSCNSCGFGVGSGPAGLQVRGCGGVAWRACGTPGSGEMPEVTTADRGLRKQRRQQPGNRCHNNISMHFFFYSNVLMYQVRSDKAPLANQPEPMPQNNITVLRNCNVAPILIKYNIMCSGQKNN